MTEPAALPEVLREETPTAKLLYLWLLKQGSVSMTHQAIADALYTERYLITTSLKRLHALGLIQITGSGYKKMIHCV